MDDWTLVVFVDFVPESVMVFPVLNLAAIGAQLGKRNPQQEATLQFTQRNYNLIRDDPQAFAALGMDVWIKSEPAEFSTVRQDGAPSPWLRMGGDHPGPPQSPE
jgi:hypothetical protein